MTEKPPLDLSRRRALAGVAGIGVGVPALAACAREDDGPETASDQQQGGGSGSTTSGTELGATSDIAVGGGAIYPDEGVVVTQPTEGEFKGFSTTCTHQGCAVAEVSGDGIVCPCHSSVFSIDDGEPQGGPAKAPLEEVALSVEGGRISLA